jgi:hypothetical protein
MASTPIVWPLRAEQELTLGSVESTTQSGNSWPWMPTTGVPCEASVISWAGGMMAASIWPVAAALVASVPVSKLLMVTLTPYFL